MAKITGQLLYPAYGGSQSINLINAIVTARLIFQGPNTPTTLQGNPVTTVVTTETDASGNFQGDPEIEANDNIAQAGTMWQFSIQPLASCDPLVLPPVKIFGDDGADATVILYGFPCPMFIWFAESILDSGTTFPVKSAKLTYAFDQSQLTNIEAGHGYVDTMANVFYMFNGESWVAISGGGDPVPQVPTGLQGDVEAPAALGELSTQVVAIRGQNGNPLGVSGSFGPSGQLSYQINAESATPRLVPSVPNVGYRASALFNSTVSTVIGCADPYGPGTTHAVTMGQLRQGNAYRRTMTGVFKAGPANSLNMNSIFFGLQMGDSDFHPLPAFTVDTPLVIEGLVTIFAAQNGIATFNMITTFKYFVTEEDGSEKTYVLQRYIWEQANAPLDSTMAGGYWNFFIKWQNAFPDNTVGGIKIYADILETLAGG